MGEKKITNYNVAGKNLQRLMLDRKELQLYQFGGATYTMVEYALTDDDIDESSVYDMPGDYFTPIEAGIGDPVTTWSDSMTTDRTGLSLFHIRDIHAAASISTSGVQVRVTIMPHSSGNTYFTHVCFAERDGSTANTIGTFGSGTFKEFLFGGAQDAFTTGGAPVESDWLTFTVDEAKSYMTLMTFGAANDNARHVTSGGDGYYEKADSAADWDQQTVTGYTLNSGYSFGIVLIEVRPAIVAQNMSLISYEDETDDIMTTARGVVLVKNKHSSTKIHVSTATSPSWTEITGEGTGATNVGDEGITEYVFGEQSITGSADKKLRWKVTTDAGHDTRVYGVLLGALSTSSTTTSSTTTSTTT
jgi:hypothetical protein